MNPTLAKPSGKFSESLNFPVTGSCFRRITCTDGYPVYFKGDVVISWQSLWGFDGIKPDWNGVLWSNFILYVFIAVVHMPWSQEWCFFNPEKCKFLH